MKHLFLEWLVNLSFSAIAGGLGGWFVAWANTYEYRKQTRARVEELRAEYQREQRIRKCKDPAMYKAYLDLQKGKRHDSE